MLTMAVGGAAVASSVDTVARIHAIALLALYGVRRSRAPRAGKMWNNAVGACWVQFR